MWLEVYHGESFMSLLVKPLICVVAVEQIRSQ